MPSASRDEIPVTAEMAGYEGRMREWGDYTVAFERIPPGNFEDLYRGLPDDRCQAPHWGYLFKGRMTIRYADGREETVTGGQAYYLPPGHTPVYEEECETVEFSPTRELQELFAVVAKNLASMEQAP